MTDGEIEFFPFALSDEDLMTLSGDGEEAEALRRRLRVRRAIERVEREVLREDERFDIDRTPHPFWRNRTFTERADAPPSFDAAALERETQRREWIAKLPRVQWVFERDWRREGWWWVAGVHWAKDVAADEGEIVYRKRIELRWQFCWPRLSVEGFGR